MQVSSYIINFMSMISLIDLYIYFSLACYHKEHEAHQEVFLLLLSVLCALCGDNYCLGLDLWCVFHRHPTMMQL